MKLTERQIEVVEAIKKLQKSDQPYIRTLGEELKMKAPNVVKYVEKLKENRIIRHEFPLKVNTRKYNRLTGK